RITRMLILIAIKKMRYTRVITDQLRDLNNAMLVFTILAYQPVHQISGSRREKLFAFFQPGLFVHITHWHSYSKKSPWRHVERRETTGQREKSAGIRLGAWGTPCPLRC